MVSAGFTEWSVKVVPGHSQSIRDHCAMLADDARAVVETRHLIVGQMQIDEITDDVAADKDPDDT